MKLLIASNNAGKILEIREILGGFFEQIASLADAGIDMDVEETGETFADNALIKARAAAELAPGWAVLADDSGLCVDALNGAPGVFSARWSGGGDAANNQKLLKELAHLRREPERSARFIAAICLIPPGREPLIAHGECAGNIAFAPAGEGGFGYDCLFLHGGRTFAQLSPAEKNSISHRKKALAALVAMLAR